MKGKYATAHYAYVPATSEGLNVIADPEPPLHQFTKRMYVVLDGSPAWVASVLCGEDEQPLRWNGWLACPAFDREVVNQIVDYIHGSPDALDVDDITSHFAWIGDVLVEYVWDGVSYGEGEPKYERTTHRPDAFGRYAIGAWAWVWYEAPVAACRGCGWSHPGWADGDACPECSKPFDWAGDV